MNMARLSKDLHRLPSRFDIIDSNCFSLGQSFREACRYT